MVQKKYFSSGGFSCAPSQSAFYSTLDKGVRGGAGFSCAHTGSNEHGPASTSTNETPDLKSIGAWATMVTTTTTARTTTMRTTGRCERGWWNGGGRGGNSKLYCLKFCFNQRKTYPKNVDLLPCLPAKTTCGHARRSPRQGTNKQKYGEECKLNGMHKRNIETYENCENRWKPLWKLLLNIWKLENY